MHDRFTACKRPKRRHHKPQSQLYAGLVLLGAGLLLMFLCIPGWAWAALAGILLIIAGYVLIRQSMG